MSRWKCWLRSKVDQAGSRGVFEAQRFIPQRSGLRYPPLSSTCTPPLPPHSGMQTSSRIPWCTGVANARGGLHNPSYFGQLPYQNKSPSGNVVEKEERDGHFSPGEVARTVPWFINNHHGNLVKCASLFIFFRWGIWDSESGCSGLPAAPPPLPKEDITTKYNKNWKTILPTTGYPTTVMQNLASAKVAMREV